MKKGTFLIAVIVTILAFNCSNNSEDDLTDVSPVQQGELITYTEHIKPIIDKSVTVNNKRKFNLANFLNFICYEIYVNNQKYF